MNTSDIQILISKPHFLLKPGLLGEITDPRWSRETTT